MACAVADMYVNNLVGGVNANHRVFYRYINSQRKDTPLKMEMVNQFSKKKHRRI